MMMMVGPFRPASTALAARIRDRTGDRDLVVARAVLDHRRRQRRIGASRQKLAHEIVEVGEAHVDRDRLVGPQQRGPVEFDRAGLAVAGDEYAGLGVVAVGERNARRRRSSRRRR